jgi:hypothetical protein
MSLFLNARKKEKLKNFIRNNSLSIVLIGITIITIICESISGNLAYNKEREDYGKPHLSYYEYLNSGHFMEGIFENWESEFLQMGLYVWLTVFLRQKGSSESKKVIGKEEVDREPDRTKRNAPLPVKKGGIWLKLYQNSLTYSFLLLFLFCIVMHAIGGTNEENAENIMKGKPERVSVLEFASSSKFWYQSFQNWQSEFLAVASIVILSIFLRQKGSPESKPVDAPHYETGE